MSIANSTMSENFADLGGGFCATSSVDKQIVTIEGTTISRNTAGGVRKIRARWVPGSMRSTQRRRIRPR